MQCFRYVIGATCFLPLLLNLPRFWDKTVIIEGITFNTTFSCDVIQGIECCVDQIKYECKRLRYLQCEYIMQYNQVWILNTINDIFSICKSE